MVGQEGRVEDQGIICEFLKELKGGAEEESARNSEHSCGNPRNRGLQSSLQKKMKERSRNGGMGKKKKERRKAKEPGKAIVSNKQEAKLETAVLVACYGQKSNFKAQTINWK